jgi:hypothetical protein
MQNARKQSLLKEIIAAAPLGISGVVAVLNVPDERRPQIVITGIWLTLVAEFLSLPVGLLLLSPKNSLANVIGGTIGLCFYLAVVLWVLRKVYLGKNWARILLLIISIMSSLGALTAHITDEINVFIFWAQTLLPLAGALCWLSPSSNKWFRTKRAPERTE